MTMRQPAPATSMGSAVMGGRMIVAHSRDGQLIKGTTQDFLPNKASFHVYLDGNENRPAVEVSLDSLKAVFFVKSLAGQKERVAVYDFDKNKGYGRKCRVTFADGEAMEGYTSGYSPDRPGFFIIPADAENNNERIFVVNKAVRDIAWA